MVVPPREGGMDQYGNTTTFNLETVIVSNIKRSDYWERRASKIGDVLELIDEVYEAVDHVEPWMSGNARGVSTAFNLIFRLGQLKPDPREIRMMLDHRDSPYIRAVGFLYLRYVCDPRKLWGWYKQYMHDSEEFSPSPPGLGESITMGDFARDILLDQFYFETIFPRVPKTVTDEIVGHLKELGLPTAAKGNGGQGGADRRGVAEPNQRPASVKASLSVAFGQRAPNRAGAREQGRGMGADLQLDRAGGGGAGRSPSPYKAEERRRDDRGDGGRDDRRRDDRRDDRDRDRRDRRGDDRSSERRGHDSRRDDRNRRDDRYDRHDRDHDRRDRYDDRRERGHDRRDGREYDRRDRDYDRRDHDRRDDRRDDRRERDHGRRDERRRSRSRSRDRHRSGSRDVRDVFRDRATAPDADTSRIREAYA